VVGIDLSPELIARAKEPETAESTHVDYVVGDIGAPGHWWDGRPFDGALCEMALMDIDDHGGTFRAVAEVLQPGAPFLASLVHPCFPGNEAGLSSWPPERGYFAEGFWSSSRHNPDGVRIRVGSNHRTVSTYINAAIDAGLVLERVIEPSGPVPMLLILACRRR
jgi:2-polyprenyl-3-methyl-5-hydroxy-6-metoxy-1,4-benzoquinol methylase